MCLPCSVPAYALVSWLGCAGAGPPRPSHARAQVGPTRYQAGRFGSGFKPRPKSDVGIRQIPLAPLVVEAIRCQLPSGSNPDDLVFNGPGGGPGQRGGPSVLRGSRTVLSRHNINRTYHGAVAKLADPAVPLRPTARRVLRALRADGPQRADQLAAQLTATSRRSIRPATVAVGLRELRPPRWPRSTSTTRTS
jgi:hypothetical protein